METLHYYAVASDSVPVQLSFILGVLLHITLFRHGEWDLKAKALCLVGFATYVLLFLLFICAFGELSFHSCVLALLSAQKVILAQLLGLTSSIMIYRVYFHRLCKFPGPILASITGWYHTYLYARRGHLYEEIQELHKRYGPVVRVAPAALSIAVSGAIPLIYAGSSTCGKGPFYNITLPRKPINFERSPEDHARRRKDWDHAFSIKALKSYEPMISVHVSKLLSQLDGQLSKPVNIAKGLNLAIFELTAQLAFGKKFTMEDEQNKQFYLRMIHDAASGLGYFAYVPWFIHLIKQVPELAKGTKRFAAYANLLVNERRKKEPEIPDIFSWMLDKYESSEIKNTGMEQRLHADAITITLAGTETTAAALTAMVHYLSHHPETMEKLREELATLEYSVWSPDHSRLKKAEYLNACINEAMRLSPPAASIGYYRQTPAEGLQVGDIRIPGDVTVIVPQYVMNHDSRFWEFPDEFIPERWTDRRELVKDGSVFVPFQIGPYGCVGRFLALMEMREYIASLLTTYDIRPAPGQTQQKFYEAQKDNMTITYNTVNIVFTKRQ